MSSVAAVRRQSWVNLRGSGADVHSFHWTSTQGRLIVAGLIGIAAFAGGSMLESEMRILLAYDLAIMTYLAMFVVRVIHSDGEATRNLAANEEASNFLTLVLAVILSGLCMVGVGFLLYRSKSWTPLMANFHLGLSLLAVFMTWALLHVIFGIHYARLYYNPVPPAGEPADRKPLQFPVDELPDFADFMYFSFTLAICYQVSDISIHSRHLRRVVLAHILLSFLNVTMILGLVVEIVSTMTAATGQSL